MIGFVIGMIVGGVLGGIGMAMMRVGSDTPMKIKPPTNKVTITGVNGDATMIVERHFNSPYAVTEAEMAAEFLLLNEGVREEGLQFGPKRMGSLIVQSVGRP